MFDVDTGDASKKDRGWVKWHASARPLTCQRWSSKLPMLNADDDANPDAGAHAVLGIGQVI
jgi:hypothetical protein